MPTLSRSNLHIPMLYNLRKNPKSFNQHDHFSFDCVCTAQCCNVHFWAWQCWLDSIVFSTLVSNSSNMLPSAPSKDFFNSRIKSSPRKLGVT